MQRSITQSAYDFRARSRGEADSWSHTTQGAEPPRSWSSLEDNGVVVIAEPVTTRPPPWLKLLLSVGTTILIVHLWYWFLPRHADGGTFTFGMSKAKKYEATAESVTFDDVAGSKSGGRPSLPKSGRSPRQRCPRGTAQKPDPLMSDDAGPGGKNTQVSPSGIRAAKNPEAPR